MNLESVKTHAKANKKVYVVGAACLTVGVLGTLAVVRTSPISLTATGDGNMLVNKARDVTNVTVTMVERSTPSKPVHLVGSNLYFNSLNEAARETGHSLGKLSRHINGHIPDVNGDVFKLLEPAA